MKIFVKDYPYIHLGLGLAGNMLFVAGSILFLQRFSSWHHVAVLIFIVGSFGMLLGSVGKAVTDLDAAAPRNRNKHSN
jgi:hypothetical protein